MLDERSTGFAVWLTGLPASGKSAIASALIDRLRERRLGPALLDSDELRRVLTPDPTYSETERDWFYEVVAYLASVLTDHGVPTIIAATANRRHHRDAARQRIERVLEVYVDCPAEICAERDPKGLYRAARAGNAPHLPGASADYEPPDPPEMTVDGASDGPDAQAIKIIHELQRRAWIVEP